MDYVDYYKVLGVDKKATTDDIKNVYRKLARKHHPDLNPNDKEANKKFQQINEANEVLSDPEKRKKYDQYGKDWKHAEEFEKQKKSGGQYANQGGQTFSGEYGENDFSDFFASMFGGQESRSRSRQTKFRGQDYNAELQVDLINAYKTHQQTITVNGKNVRITIPAGIENGQQIRLKGYGAQGVNGGPNGDLYITFSITNNTQFKRTGNDLYTTIEIDLYTAVLGGEVTVDTLNGKVKLKVKPETQNGAKMRLKAKGFPLYKKEEEYGDLFITFSVTIPTGLTEKQKELFKELAKTTS